MKLLVLNQDSIGEGMVTASREVYVETIAGDSQKPLD